MNMALIYPQVLDRRLLHRNCLAAASCLTHHPNDGCPAWCVKMMHIVFSCVLFRRHVYSSYPCTASCCYVAALCLRIIIQWRQQTAVCDVFWCRPLKPSLSCKCPYGWSPFSIKRQACMTMLVSWRIIDGVQCWFCVFQLFLSRLLLYVRFTRVVCWCC